MHVLSEYLDRRCVFYSQYGQLWPNTLNEPYDILDSVPISLTKMNNIRQTTSSILKVYKTMARYIKYLSPDDLIRLGVPTELAWLSGCESAVDEVLFSRMDFSVKNKEIKLLEVNFDAPGLAVETFEINNLVCEDAGRQDPNYEARRALGEQMHRAVEQASGSVGKSRDQCLVGVCHRRGYGRDAEVARYFVNLLSTHTWNSSTLVLQEITGDENGLYDSNGRQIHVLLRVCPLLDLVRGVIPYKSSCTLDSRQLTRLCSERRISILSPPTSALLESKMVQSLIWQMLEEGIAFSASEQETIRKNMLPTKFFPDPSWDKFVVKPTYGCGGSGIKVVSKDGVILDKGRTEHRGASQFVYQKYIDIAAARTMTEVGPQELNFVMSVWTIAANEVGICYRAGHGITDSAWWVVPVYLCSADEQKLCNHT
jgi:glutathionylspermidine synthase